MGYLTTRDVCGLLHLDRKKVYALYKVKGFPVVRIGNDYRVDENDLMAFMKMYKGSKINL